MTLDGTFTRVNASTALIDEQDVSGILGSPVELVGQADGTRIFRDYEAIYRTNPWLFATIRLFAKGAGRMPLHLMQLEDPDPDGDGVDIDRRRIRPQTSPGADPKLRRAVSLARAIRRPGHRISDVALKRSTMTDDKVRGRALWVIERDRYGDYVGFERIPARYVRHDKVAGVVRYWDVRTPQVKHLADDVIHFGLGSDCSPLDAPSPIDALHATLALYDAVERHLVAVMKNGVSPSGHYKVSPGTGKTARQKIAEVIRELYSGPDNAGRPLITSAEWQEHGNTPDHSRFVSLAKAAREEIVAVYNMPPPLVGILDRAIMSNVRELRSHYARDVVGPDLVGWEGDIDAQLVAQDPLLADDFYLEFQLAAVMRPDPEAQIATYRDRRLIESVNEIRATIGRNRIDDPAADVPWMPTNEAPLGTATPTDQGPGLMSPTQEDSE